MRVYACWNNSKALVQRGLACVRERESTVGPGEQGFWGDHKGRGQPQSPLPFVHDMPGHVTTGSHRDAEQSETRGQRVRAACLFHCLCGVPHCWTQKIQSWNISINPTAQTDWMRQDRGSTVPACLWELTQQQQRAFPLHLSVCRPPLSPSLHLSVTRGGEKGKQGSLFPSLYC